MLRGCFFDRALHGILVAGVADDVRALDDVGADDGRALASEQLDGRFADARRGAGDDRDLAFQPAHRPLIASANNN